MKFNNYCMHLKHSIFLVAIHSISGPGSINDITPNDIILLTGRQKITGRTTFNQLEVTQSFDVSIQQ